MAQAVDSNVSFIISAVFLCLVGSVMSARVDYSGAGEFHGSGAEVNAKLGFITPGCDSLQAESLAQILGPAYNPRYMSVNAPRDVNDDDSSDTKRKAEPYRQFFVDGDYSKELGDTPAWEKDHFKDMGYDKGSTKREKRSASPLRPWECQATVKWIDLGMDYFPRYLRSVECTKHDCWYGKFSCKARSFSVKLLRRKRGKCAYQNRKEGVTGLPQELRELWVWEERAVNFCCDCAPS